MTRRIVLLTLAVTSLVVIAFLVPLLSLVRDVAASQATIQASVQAQSAAALVNRRPDGAQLDRRRPADHGRGRYRRTAERAWAPARRRSRDAHGRRGGRDQAATFDVRRRPGGAGPGAGRGRRHAVVRTFVPDAELHSGCRPGVARADRAGLVLLAGAGLLAAADRRAGWCGRCCRWPARGHAAGRRPVRPGDAGEPAEVRAVADALNGLADRISDLLQEEREAAPTCRTGCVRR